MRNTPQTFWNNVEVSVDTECWNWKKSRDTQGYGMFMYQKKHYKSHRLALIFSGVDIPDGMIVMHSCDNPSCCNPQHLRVGTHKENSVDMANKGRAAKGMEKGAYKHSPEAIEKMRLAKLGKKRKPFTEEHKAKLAAALARGNSR